MRAILYKVERCITITKMPKKAPKKRKQSHTQRTNSTKNKETKREEQSTIVRLSTILQPLQTKSTRTDTTTPKEKDSITKPKPFNKQEELEELIPKAILGIRRKDEKWEYAVEFNSKVNKEHSSIMVCSSEYLAESCPALLIYYLEQHVVADSVADSKLTID
eukprot:TRINITY_DN2177_c0_g5_i1.p1 TRINITY_DN2177_c0_g5~~TRINITY_DN2177_c0_g5_i1.p1  ORF type:complete len:162 (+),score=18.87 TRINITY_DN2177_c0_g5_i1:53-538(+)